VVNVVLTMVVARTNDRVMTTTNSLICLVFGS
jgi:hypothetical protein